MAREGWHQLRFEERSGPRIVATACDECARPMWLPASKADLYKRCGPACNRAWHERQKAQRDRPCETCGVVFRPRQYQLDHGGGRYCSQMCNTAGQDALNSPEAQAKGRAILRDMIRRGEVKRYVGEDNPRWKGGPKAARRRQIESGQSAAQLRNYRAKHPHRVREWYQNRKHAKVGRLPYGTIPRIGELQRWKCALCRVSVKKHYHVDHITALSRGGLHEPRNIQLLCGPCNLRKHAKDQIDFMQERGMLL